MSAIKKFFEKKKLDAKFKMAGSGHRLTAEARKSAAAAAREVKGVRAGEGEAAGQQQAASRALTESQVRAARAAEARLQQGASQSKPLGTSAKAIARQVRKELEEERRQQDNDNHDQRYSPISPSTSSQSTIPQVMCDESGGVESASTSTDHRSGLLYTCQLVGNEVLPYDQQRERIRSFLYDEYEEEPVLTSALMLVTLGGKRDKVDVAKQTLIRYLDNLINAPEEEKYRRIRFANAAFRERVACVEGAIQFLKGLGFTQQELPGASGENEAFWVITEAVASNTARLVECRDALLSAEPIRPQLHRNIKVYAAEAASVTHFNLPDGFFDLTVEELAKEQSHKKQHVDRELTLRTRAMREQDNKVSVDPRRYPYALIRVRFPDNLVLQATFLPYEPVEAVYRVVRECLVHDWCSFHLSIGTGQRLDRLASALYEMSLVPTAVLNFSWDEGNEVRANATSETNEILRADVLENIETLSIE